MEEDIKLIEEIKYQLIVRNKQIENDTDNEILMSDYEYRKEQILALDNVLEYIDKLEEKLMYALSPTNHELALETKRNFKKIIMKNIDEDTYTIKRELKKYWNNMNTYWLGDE